MRIVIISESFAKNMGYLANTLPKRLAALGAEVHLVTTRLAPYHNIADFENTYKGFVETGSEGSQERLEGFTVHYLPVRRVLGYTRIEGLSEKLGALQPDIVQIHTLVGWIPLDVAAAKLRHGFTLFSGSNYTASVFPLATTPHSKLSPAFLKSLFLRAIPGRVVSWLSHTCYAATVDCADVAIRFFGAQEEKVAICPLGVDETLFHPAADDRDRAALRAQLGYRGDELVCVYSGRFTEDKNPLLLAKAIERLVAAGRPFRGLFIGNGPQAEAIAATPGCQLHPFVPFQELGRFFRASDVGVWPTQESMSMIDAAACGIPIIVNDTLAAVERVEGNGLQYRLGDLDDLVAKLETLADPQLRERLGREGARKMAMEYTWGAIAQRRLRDYAAALRKPAA